MAEAAQKVLPIEIPTDEQQFEELTVMVHRCTGLDNIRKGRFCKRRYLSIRHSLHISRHVVDEIIQDK